MGTQQPLIEDLPAIPLVAQQVITAASDENCDVRHLAEVVGSDEGMVAKILRIANSSLYGLSRRVHSLDRAVAATGFNTVKQLALAMSMRGTYEAFGETEGHLWEHSVGASIASFLVAKRMGAKHPEAAFTAGLLHDIGKAILAHRSPDKYSGVTEAVASGVAASEAERQAFDVTHSLMGAKALKQWCLPESAVTAVRFHHTPGRWSDEGPDQGLLVSVVMGNMVCHLLGLGCKRDLAASDEGLKKALVLSGIAAKDVLELVTEAREKYLAEKKAFA